MMSLGQRLDRVLAVLIMEPQASAVDYSRDRVSQGSGGHGAHGDPSRKPTNTHPLRDQYRTRFERLIEEAEVDAGLRGAVERVERKNIRAILRQRMHEYEGRDPVYVAFHENCSTELVRAVRKDLGLNMVTGERLTPRERPLTAPARDTLRVLQDVIGGEL